MKREIIEPKNESEWLALRELDVTSTMSAALFDLSPWTTKFELYHAKKSKVQVPFAPNERMKSGLSLEPYAAAKVAGDNGWTHHKITGYARLPELRMGSSFDYLVCGGDGREGILELKAVDYGKLKTDWLDDEAPPHIEVQAQHQMECLDKDWCAIAAFYSIYDYRMIIRERDREMGSALREAVKMFWQWVDNANEPEPDYFRDAAVINELYKPEGELADYTADYEMNLLLADYRALQAEEKAIEKKAKAAKAEIFAKLKNSAGGYTSDYCVTSKMTKPYEGKLITEDMVGTRIGARDGYRNLTVKELKK
jgi:putative phage-type endonuclease